MKLKDRTVLAIICGPAGLASATHFRDRAAAPAQMMLLFKCSNPVGMLDLPGW